MTDSGLNQRLRQRSRRSGLMIGVSMALTLMVCVGAFTIIFAKLEPIVSDFVGQGDIVLPTPIPTQPPPPTEPPADTTQSNEPPATGGDNQADTVQPTVPTEFTPDYQTDAGRSVNLRPGPGISSGEPIVAVPNGAPLMYLNESEPTTDPAGDGMEENQVWMKFRTEDGEEGWIRELDVIEYQP